MILLVLALATALQVDEPFHFEPRIGLPPGGEVKWTPEMGPGR